MKNTSLTAMIAAAALVIGVTTAFATSAKADESTSVEDLDRWLDKTASVAEGSMMMSMNPANLWMDAHEMIAASADFTLYEPFGLVWNDGEKALYWNGRLVSTFADLTPEGGAFTFSSAKRGGVAVKTIYDESGNLTGVEPVTA